MGLRVLLVEDDAVLADGLLRALRAQDMTVTQVADGLAADRALQEPGTEVAVLDIGLPGIDGYEVARRLRADAATRAIRLIAVTGYGLPDDQRRVMEAGFDQHLVKPVQIERLLEALAPVVAPTPAGTAAA